MPRGIKGSGPYSKYANGNGANNGLVEALSGGVEVPELEEGLEMPAKRGPGRPKAAEKNKEEIIEIPEIQLKVMTLTLEGVTPLIVHKFSKKSETEMAEKQAGEKAGKQKKAPKIPVEDFKESLYTIDGRPASEIETYVKNGKTYAKTKKGAGFGFPGNAFKNAAVSACRLVDGLSMTMAKGLFFVLDDMVEIIADDPWMRTDVVRLNSGFKPVADLRYRPEFTHWKVKLQVEYMSNVVKPKVIANLLNHAGFSVGIGEWRPEKDGKNGKFRVAMGNEAILG